MIKAFTNINFYSLNVVHPKTALLAYGNGDNDDGNAGDDRDDNDNNDDDGDDRDDGDGDNDGDDDGDNGYDGDPIVRVIL